MQIHELNTFSGTPGASDYLATDNGADTSKIAIKTITDPLNDRINNIIAGPAPSAEEIVDARIGADGTTYTSLGDAIRGQASILNDDIKAVNADLDLSYNGDKEYSIEWSNKAIDGNTGSVISTSQAARAATEELIRIPENGQFRIVSTSGNANIYKYDSDGTYLGFETSVSSIWYEFANVRYIRLLKTQTPQDAESTTTMYMRYASDGFAHEDAFVEETQTNIVKTSIGKVLVFDDVKPKSSVSVESDDFNSSSRIVWSNKNLFAINPNQDRIVRNGVEFTFNKDKGTIRCKSVSGATATTIGTSFRQDLNGNGQTDVNFVFSFPIDTVVTVSANASEFREYKDFWNLNVTDGATGTFDSGEGYTFVAKAGVEYGVRIIIYKGFVSSEGLVLKPQVEVGSHKTAWERHVGNIIPANADRRSIAVVTNNAKITSGNASYFLNKMLGDITISADAEVASDTVIYDPSKSQVHGLNILTSFTYDSDKFVTVYGGTKDINFQITDGTHTFVDMGDGVGFVAKADIIYAVRGIIKAGYIGNATIKPQIATGRLGIIGLKDMILYTNDGSDLTVKYTAESIKDSMLRERPIVESINRMTAGKILNPYSSMKPIVTFIDDDTSSLVDVDNYASVFNALGVRGTYAVMTRNLENSAELKERLLELETEGHGMVFHCEYQEGDETNYFLHDENRDIQLVRENITLGLRQMETYGFTNYKYWVTPYGVNDEDIVNVAKDYGFECLISMSNNAFVSNTGNSDRYNIPRYSVSVSTADDFPTIKNAAEACLADNGWMLIVTHANTWRHEGVVEEMQTKLTNVINYLMNAGFEIVPFARAYESRKSMFYFNELFK